MNPLKTIDAKHYVRGHFLGGSDIAGVLGLQPPAWRTAVQIWERKGTEEVLPYDITPKEQRKVLARGQIVEPLVAKMLEILHGITGATKGNRYIDASYPIFAAEIDMEIAFKHVAHLFDGRWDSDMVDEDEIVNVEIKTVHPFAAKEWGEEGTEEVPIHYAAQILWGLGVTGRKFAICAALFGADDLVLYPIVRDEETVRSMRDKAWSFWNDHVVPGIPPAPSTLKDCGLLWPSDDGSQVKASEEIRAACVTLNSLTQSRLSYEKGEEGIQLLIREYMKNGSSLVIDDVEIATLKEQSTQSVDAAKLKELYPDAFKQCRRTTTYRRLIIKEKNL